LHKIYARTTSANVPPAYPVIVAGAKTAKREQDPALHKINVRFLERTIHSTSLISEIGAAVFNEYVLTELIEPNE
jgi:hypothetical protein